MRRESDDGKNSQISEWERKIVGYNHVTMIAREE